MLSMGRDKPSSPGAAETFWDFSAELLLETKSSKKDMKREAGRMKARHESGEIIA